MRRLWLIFLLLTAGTMRGQVMTFVTQSLVNAGPYVTGTASIACAAGHTATVYVVSGGATDSMIFTPPSGPSATAVITNAHGTISTIGAWVLQCDGVTRTYTYGDTAALYPTMRFIETSAGVMDTTSVVFGSPSGGFSSNPNPYTITTANDFISVQMYGDNNSTAWTAATGYTLLDNHAQGYYYASGLASGAQTFPTVNTGSQHNNEIASAIVALKPNIGSSLSASPTTIAGPSTGNVISMSCTGCAWTPGTPGSPVLTIAGVAGVTKTAQTITSASAGTITLTVGTTAGTETITDPSTAATAPLTITVASLAAPTFTPGASSFSSTTSVTIGVPAGSTGCYTTNGTTPAATTPGTCSTGTAYTTALTFSATTTLNALATQVGQINSSVTSAVYTLRASTTWYIRNDGGSRYSSTQTSGQCDGLGDVAYSGTDPNQHCAFNDYRYLWDDKSYGSNAWVIFGGDTVIIRGGPWRVGFSQGASGSDVWCTGGSGPFNCFNPTIPAGTAGRHTRILGENYAACNMSNHTQIFGGFGVNTVLNENGAQYVDVQCLEITRHSQCIRHGSPAYPSYCSSSYPIDDYDTDGVTTTAATHDIAMTDVWIHGHTDRGIIGPIGANIVCTRCIIAYNGMAGWDFDNGSAQPFGANATWTFNYSTIEWNGCNQEYPSVSVFPAISCYGQSSAGYGDGLGSAQGTGSGLDVHIDHSIFRYNTQDGYDFGHMDFGSHIFSTTNSIAYGNGGQQMKWGYNFTTLTFYNNVLIGSCTRMGNPLTGTPTSYNTNLGDFCRAQSTLSWNYLNGSVSNISYNTFITYSPTVFVIGCLTPSGCPTATATFKNNIVLGYDNPQTYSLGGKAGGPGLFYCQNSTSIQTNCDTFITWNRSNNNYFQVAGACPTLYGETCVNPLLNNQPTTNVGTFIQSQLDLPALGTLSFVPTSGSPLRGAGVATGGVTLDYYGLLRSSPPDEGATQYLAGIPSLLRALPMGLMR